MGEPRSLHLRFRGIRIWLVAMVFLLCFGSAVVGGEVIFAERFDQDLGAFSSFTSPGCDASAYWRHADSCPSSGLAPSPPGHALGSSDPACAVYAEDDSLTSIGTSPIDISSCIADLTLSYWYRLDFDEGPTYDRAQAVVLPRGG